MTAHFSASWLALREPADRLARSEGLVRAVRDGLPSGRAIAVLDLASGTGANARYLGDRLQLPQHWVLADHDEELLALARETVPVPVSTRLADLSRLDADPALLAGHDVITASALLDLVSDTWLRSLLTRCHALHAHVLFALNYDGRIECAPAEAGDERVRELVNRHQRTDKGFGPALGPDAAARAAYLLEELGYRVLTEPSDWVLGPDAGSLQQQLIDGWVDAASRVAPQDAALLEDWRARRQQHVAARRSRIRVGHQDVLGLAPAIR